MELGALAAGLEVDAIEGEPRVDVRGIAIDSRDRIVLLFTAEWEKKFARERNLQHEFTEFLQ